MPNLVQKINALLHENSILNSFSITFHLELIILNVLPVESKVMEAQLQGVQALLEVEALLKLHLGNLCPHPPLPLLLLKHILKLDKR